MVVTTEVRVVVEMDGEPLTVMVVLEVRVVVKEVVYVVGEVVVVVVG